MKDIDRTREGMATVVIRRITLRDGRMVILFVNRATRLVVLDIVEADESGGIEVYRKHV